MTREPLSLLAQDLNHPLVRAAIRRELWAVLVQIGAVDASVQPPAPTDPPRLILLEHLRRQGLDPQSFEESIRRLSDDERARLLDPDRPSGA